MFDINDLNNSLQAIGAKSIEKLNACIADLTYTSAGTYTSIKNVLSCFACNPACWSCVFPHLQECKGYVKVCDSSSFFRCGSSCTWTVPTEANFIKFELWGPGASGGAGLCCGGSPPGPTGAYATLVLPAVAGCQYVLCAGCASCCASCCTDQFTSQGSPSYATGYGLTNFCAEGGCHNIIRAACLQRTVLCGTGMCCRWQNPSCSTSGACICGTSSFCFSSCATCGEIPVFSDTQVTFYGTAFGHNSIHPATCFDGNFCGYYLLPPLVSPRDGKTPISICQTFNSTSCSDSRFRDGGACRACFNSEGTIKQPGHGGFGVAVHGGFTSTCSDWGRAGMVKVSWC